VALDFAIAVVDKQTKNKKPYQKFCCYGFLFFKSNMLFSRKGITMNINVSLLKKTNFQYLYKKILAFTISCSCSLLSVGIAIAETADNSTDININSSPLTGTNPANNSFANNGNGIQQINGGNFSGTLTAPTCTSRFCLFGLNRITPNGSESIFGAILNLGGSADEDRAAAEKLRIEMENIKNTNDYRLQLIDKMTAAIDSGNSVRIRAIAIALAPLLDFKDFREYLRALLNENS
jgi:hypothetical protein